MSRGERGRLGWLLGSATVIALLLLLRAGHLTLIRHEYYRELAERQQTQVVKVPPLRGRILDRNGSLLACSVENASLAVVGGKAEQLERLARDLQGAGVCTAREAWRIASPAGSYRWITRRWVPEALARRLSAQYDCVRLEPEIKRFYPLGPVAPQVLGLVGVDDRGLSGLEACFNDWLRGEPGRKLCYVTGAGRPQQTRPPKALRPAQPGGGLLLTIDARIDEIVRFRLQEGMARIGAQSGFALVLDPWTGEILALCGEPCFDPLAGPPGSAEPLRVCGVMDQFEPGSTFKITTFSAALESGLVAPADTIDCLGGVRIVGGAPIRDLKKLDRVTAGEVLIHSSNIGNGLIAEQIGWERVCGMAQALGFGQATGIRLGGEATGQVPHPLREGWSGRSLATMAYGQEISVTGLQMALAYGAIANGGFLMRPILVRATLDARGQVVEQRDAQVVRRVMSPETAATMTTLLRRVVTEGTGRAAEVSCIPPAGKTGTAQVYDPQAGCYSRDDHVLGFIGFAPHTRPRCLIEVCLSVTGEQHAGEAAAPIFASILRDLTWFMEEGGWEATPMHLPETCPVIVPDVRGLDPQAARRVLHRAGLLPVLEGRGPRVARLSPAPYATVTPGSVVRLALAGRDPHGTLRIPRVAGLALREAVALLSEAGLTAGVHGSGWVVRQSPEAGSDVPAETLCEIWASPRRSRARDESLRRMDLACDAADGPR
ncbi:MAG: PASTA domain-containing protein [Candidatus Eisenbacteria sp.]|nr:PASTA domain-containing protein [Candidatus Eisenbacteria bacterium]